MEVLNRWLNKVKGYMRANKLRLSLNKTEVLVINYKGGSRLRGQVAMGGVALSVKEQAHILGVLLDSGLLLKASIALFICFS